MAKTKVESDVGSVATGQSKEKKQLLTDLRNRFSNCLEADDDQRRDAMEDMKFTNVPGHQWDDNMKKFRGDRPCYEFNKIRVTAKRIINNMRTNRPGFKVRPTEDGDEEIARIFEGLIRNIWSVSNGDSVADYAAEYQVPAGYGAWRIVTDYADDDVFNQDIRVEAIPNPFCLFSDPASKDPLKRDARYWILTDRIAREVYEERWPKADVVNFESHEFDDDDNWDGDDDEVRIAEYWWKEPVTKEIWLLDDQKGTVIDSESDEAAAIEAQTPELIVKRRTVKTDKTMMCIASGSAILEGPVDWAGKMFPFVPLYGEYYIIDGATHWSGIARYARDAQQSYNFSRTAIAETIAMAPKSKFWATTKQAEGQIDNWEEADAKNYPFQLYNPDNQAPGPPSRMGPPDIPVALIQEVQLAAEEINMVTGIYQADLGSPNSATSGKQELVRQQAGHIATFNYEDNMVKAVQYTGEILMDLIPQIYDTQREIRILGLDGEADYKRVNSFVPDQKNGEPIKINDLAAGKYDLISTSGPSFASNRAEASEFYQSLVSSSPQLFPVMGDVMLGAMDYPGAEEIADRLKAMAPPPIQALLNNEADLPPEALAVKAQAEQMIRNMQEQVRQAMEEVRKQREEIVAGKQENAKAAQAVTKQLNELALKMEQFQTDIANGTVKTVTDENKLLRMEASLCKKVIKKEEDDDDDGDDEKYLEQMEAMNDLMQKTTIEHLKMMNGMRQSGQPKVVRIEQQRVNGKLVATPVYEGDAEINSEMGDNTAQ